MKQSVPFYKYKKECPNSNFVNLKCIQRRISELFRNKVVQYFVEIGGCEICRSINI
jgi:hypothetical protein